MTSQGSAYARFLRALANGNLTMVDAAARELTHVKLEDALQIVLLMDSTGDARFERAAVRWLCRLAQEKPEVGLEDLETVVEAFKTVPAHDAAGKLMSFCCAPGRQPRSRHHRSRGALASPTSDEARFNRSGMSSAGGSVPRSARNLSSYGLLLVAYDRTLLRWPELALGPDAPPTTEIDEARAFIEDAYARRLRRRARSVDHPVAVAELLAANGQPVRVVVAGLLHDVLEDTEVTPDELSERFGPEVVAVVNALTQDESAPEYAERKRRLRRKAVEAGHVSAAVALADKLAKLERADAPPRPRKLRHYRATLRAVEAAYGPSRLATRLGEHLEHWPVA
jgi:HD domain-containing protein